jgi:F0F1-type ATP synthase assembly protein I
VGLERASRVTTIGLEFAIPALVGYGVDSWLHTAPVATIIGAVLGFVTGLLHTVRMSGQLLDGSRPGTDRSGDRSNVRDPSGKPT